MSGSKKGSAAGRVVGRILLVILIIAAAAGIAALAAVLRLKANFTELKRVDGMGSLYSVEYTGNYYSPLVKLPYKILKPVKDSGCSCFFVQGPDGKYLLFATDAEDCYYGEDLLAEQSDRNNVREADTLTINSSLFTVNFFVLRLNK